MSSQDLQETMKGSRKSLMTIQQTSLDRENLVGRVKNLKHQLTQDSTVDVEIKRKIVVSSKETQANLDTKITADDLTNPEGASEKYWEVLAGKRQVALQDALEENERLRKIIEDLKEENTQYKQMLEEANSFVEVIKEELASASNDDTGIDVNDVSAADETLYETAEDESADNEPKAKASKTE